MKKNRFIPRDISWLAFNNRVLQEAADKTVPLRERIKFLGIVSNNLDEFFRVRVAAVRRLAGLKLIPTDAKKKARKLLEAIKVRVLEQQEKFNDIYENSIIPALAKNGIDIIDEAHLSDSELKLVRQHFSHVVSQKLFPLILEEARDIPFLKDGDIYLAVKLSNSTSGDVKYALMMGILLGWQKTILSLYIAFIIGAIVGLTLIIFKKHGKL